MLRITLTGDALSDFPEGFEGGYIKLAIDDPAGNTALRSFTVRDFDPSRPALVIEMVAHGDAGPAGRWANRVQVGDALTIVGPGPVKRLAPDADWYLIAGDMSALPAISVNLAALPPDATGHAVLEVISRDDEIALDKPAGVEVTWLINPHPNRPDSKLEDAVKAIPWRDGRVSVWAAGEYARVRAVRQYIRNERRVDPKDAYVSCYWKIGDTDEQMKAAKRADPEGW